MQLKTIQYSESYEFSEYGLKRWRKFGLEGELGENEDPLNAHTQLKTMVDAMKAASIAELDQYRGTTVREIPEIQEDKAPNPLQGTLDGINNSQNMEELKGFWLLSKGNLVLSSAYKTKEKQLNDAITK